MKLNEKHSHYFESSTVGILPKPKPDPHTLPIYKTHDIIKLVTHFETFESRQDQAPPKKKFKWKFWN